MPNLKRDGVPGMGAVLTAGLAIAIYYLGGLGRLEVGWDALTVAVVTLPASALRLPTPADRPAVRALSA